ncbi:MAG: polysaccharide ABC transporter, partial [Bacilli bacterium]|nr:polysaccharide ABC transporter [Bacilli bacterium]
ILLIIYKVPLTFSIIHIIPVFIVLFVVSFGISSILMHFGIFVEDLSNVTAIVLKLLFYLSGIFYSIVNRIPVPYNFYLVNFNPGAFFIHQFRLILLEGQAPNYIGLSIWFVVGILLTSLGVRIIHKYENSYAKVI